MLLLKGFGLLAVAATFGALALFFVDDEHRARVRTKGKCVFDDPLVSQL